jgi:[acyl-carrier-protein] S-malonyltransferase
MGKDLYDNFKVAREVFQETDDALGFSISSLCFDGSEDELKLTINTQPAILAVSIAALRVLNSEIGLTPILLAGHSLGEYSALAAAESFRFFDAIRAVRQRGRFMQEAVPVGVGAMAAILGMEGGEIDKICCEAADDQVVSPANFNSPEQIVISGHKEAVMRAVELARARGAKRAVVLPVSAPFHTSLMGPAAKRMAAELEGVLLGDLKVPVISNVEADINISKEEVKDLLVRQLTHLVRWKESMDMMILRGIDTIIEVGPGRVLSGLMRKINREVTTLNMENKNNIRDIQKMTEMGE